MFRILDSKTVKVLLVASFKLSLQLHPILILEESKCISKMSYANVIGCLMYLMVCTRLNISNAAIVASKYMTDPKKKKEHWTEVNWILRYLTDTRALGTFFNQI